MNNIREDLDRYFFLAEAESPLKKLYMVLFTQGIWATLVYRSGRYLLMNRRGNAVKVFVFKLLGMGMSIGQKFIIGNEVAIGANAFVNRAIPGEAVAAGIPCNVVNHKGSRDFIRISPEALDRWKGRYDASGNA